MVSNLKAVEDRGGEAILGPEALTPLTPRRGSEHEHSENFRLNLVSSLFLLFLFALPLPLARETSSSGAHTTRPIRARVCVSQRVRVISRLERLQVREEAANV